MTASNWRVSVRKDPNEVARLVGADGVDLERSPFQRPQWLETWFGSFAAQKPSEICAVTIEDMTTGEVVFVLPLVIEHARGVVKLKAWDFGVSDYNAPVLSKNFSPSPADMNTLWAEILRALPRADMIELEKVPSAIGDVGNPLLGVSGVQTSTFTRHPLPLDGDFEGLASRRFNPTHRRSLARKRRKLHNKGCLAFVLLEGEDALPTLEQVLAWRRGRFSHQQDPGEADRVDDFYRSLCLHTDLARVGRLSLDGRLIAGCFGTLTDDTFQLLVVAHDGGFKNWSPGLLVIESSIEHLCARGVTVYDFTIGGEPYKLDFGVDVEALYELQAPLSLKGLLYMRLRMAVRAAKRFVRRIVPRKVRRAMSSRPVDEAEAVAD